MDCSACSRCCRVAVVEQSMALDVSRSPSWYACVSTQASRAWPGSRARAPAAAGGTAGSAISAGSISRLRRTVRRSRWALSSRRTSGWASTTASMTRVAFTGSPVSSVARRYTRSSHAARLSVMESL